MALTSLKNGRAHVIEMANRAVVQKLAGESLSGLTVRLDNHESGINYSAHGIPNIAGLGDELDLKADAAAVQDALDLKADVFTGFTGTVSVVTSVNFVTQTVTTKTITVSNGIVTNIV